MMILKRDFINTKSKNNYSILYSGSITFMFIAISKVEKNYFKNINIFIYCFIILLFTELAVRYTGIYPFILYIFILLPFTLLMIIYSLLIYKFSKESLSSWINFFKLSLIKFLKTFFVFVVVFYCFGVILNLFEEIEFFKNMK